MVVKEYIEKLQKEGDYEEIRAYIKNYEMEKKEFLQTKASKEKGWSFIVIMLTLIVVIGTKENFRDINILAKVVYLIPSLVICIMSIKAHCQAKKKQYLDYKSLKNFDFWFMFCFAIWSIYMVPILYGDFIGKISTNFVLKFSFCILGVLFLSTILFSNLSKKILTRKVNKSRKDKSSQINATSVFASLGSFVGVMYIRKISGGSWMIPAILIVGILFWFGTVITYFEWKMIGFMENDIRGYLKDKV